MEEAALLYARHKQTDGHAQNAESKRAAAAERMAQQAAKTEALEEKRRLAA